MSHTAGRVHMAQNKVAAEFLASSERLLEIDARPDADLASLGAERGFADGFAGEVGGEAPVVDSNDGQAAAVHGDAVRDSERRSEGRCMNRNAPAIAMEIEGLDGA